MGFEVCSVLESNRGLRKSLEVKKIFYSETGGHVLTPFFGTCQVQRRKEVGGLLWSEGGKSAYSDD
jgi:hypothetical protein